MRIEIAEKSGFCFGVKRAIELTEKAAAQYGGVMTLGPLIHNKIVTDSLEERGVKIAESAAEAAGKKPHLLPLPNFVLPSARSVASKEDLEPIE